jgi:hypothetical protein
MRSTATFDAWSNFTSSRALTSDEPFSPNAARPFVAKRTEAAGATSTEDSFGPLRLLRTQFILPKRDKPEHLGSRRAAHCERAEQ